MLHSALIHEEMPYTETLIDRFREFALLGSVINMRNKLDQVNQFTHLIQLLTYYLLTYLLTHWPACAS